MKRRHARRARWEPRRSRPRCWQCEALRVENAALLEEHKRLLKENERLVRENEAGDHEIARLRERLSEAQRAAKRQAAPFSKGAPKADPKRRGRKPGRQYGVRAHRTPPQHIDEVIDVPRPDRCECGG